MAINSETALQGCRGKLKWDRAFSITDGSIVVEIQRRLARAGYYRGAIDGVISHGSTVPSIRMNARMAIRVDGQIDQRLLATTGLA
jgi:peptidoglycan hydrolase-like protein with peptidoglycan-binding domain